MTHAPTLHTAHLTLRDWREDDFAAYAAIYADEDAARYVGGVRDEVRSWRDFASHIGHWRWRGYGMFAAEESDTGAFVGFGGPWNPHGWPEPEIGYVVAKAHWRKGYATEIALRTRQYAYEQLDWTTAVSLIHADNIGSKAVARRCGAAPERTITLLGDPCEIWRHPGPEVLGRLSTSTSN